MYSCRLLGGCRTGDAKRTPGFGLRARWIVHTVGPVWRGGDHGEAELLASCYRRSLELALEVDAVWIAFPAISTGIYGYPIELATRIAVDTITFITAPDEVVLVGFDQVAATQIRAVLDERS